MPRLVPEQPTFTTASEQEVWERLRDGLGADDVLLANLRLTDETKDHEADLDRADARGRRRRGRGQGRQRLVRRGRLVAEARAGRTARSTRSSRCGRRSTRSATTSRATRAGTTATTSRGVTRSSRRTPTSRPTSRRPTARAGRCTTGATRTTSPRGCGENAVRARRASPPPTHDDVDAHRRDPRRPHAHVVRRERRGRGARGRGRPAHPGAGDDPAGHPAAAPRRGARRGGQRQDRARPAAGQGAHPAAAATARPSASRCCATRSAWPSTSSARWRRGTRKHRPAFVGTFHEFGKQWGAPDGDRTDSDFWEETLPDADGRPRGGRCRTAGSTTRSSSTRRRTSPTPGGGPCSKSLRDEEEGGLYVYSDENQRIFARFGRPPVPARPARARPQPPQHPADPRVVRAAGAEPDVRARGRRAGRPLRAAPRRRTRSASPTTRSTRCSRRAGGPENVCLLTTGHRHPVQHRAHRVPRPGRLLADVLGQRRRLLRPRPRLQGARAPRRRAVRQRVRGRATAPGSGCTSGCRAPRTSSWSWATRRWSVGSVATRSRGGWGSADAALGVRLLWWTGDFRRASWSSASSALCAGSRSSRPSDRWVAFGRAPEAREMLDALDRAGGRKTSRKSLPDPCGEPRFQRLNVGGRCWN